MHVYFDMWTDKHFFVHTQTNILIAMEVSDRTKTGERGRKKAGRRKREGEPIREAVAAYSCFLQVINIYIFMYVCKYMYMYVSTYVYTYIYIAKYNII